jgi:hypothetical protein
MVALLQRSLRQPFPTAQLMTFAISNATSKLPHLISSSNLVFCFLFGCTHWQLKRVMYYKD